MPYFNRTYRIVDGERIDGSWRHVFIKNGNTYFLTDLKVYADGMIDCWGLVDLATFRQKVASGWVATSYPQGAQASAHLLADWHFDQPESWLTQEQLIAEVADEIEHLAGRPTSEDRCRTALDRYLDEPSEVHLAALREAYIAVPEHLRRFLLGDQDTKDYPLRALITPVGEVLVGEPPDESESVVQPRDHEEAWAYFQGRREEQRQLQAAPPPWKDDPVASNPSVIRFDRHDGGHPYLANGYPAPIALAEGVFPTVEHAYWALSATDHETREKIAHASTAREARQLGQDAPHRPDWSVVRLAVMLRLVRESFTSIPTSPTSSSRQVMVASSMGLDPAATGAALVTKDAIGWDVCWNWCVPNYARALTVPQKMGQCHCRDRLESGSRHMIVRCGCDDHEHAAAVKTNWTEHWCPLSNVR